MLTNNYTVKFDSFIRLDKEIFSRVYLYSYLDKNTNLITFDIIHAVTPLIFKVDPTFIETFIENGQDDFSLSLMRGRSYCVDVADTSAINDCMKEMLLDYTENFNFFNVHSIKEYVDKYKVYSDLLSNKSEKMDEECSFNGYEYMILLLYLKEYDKCVDEIDAYLKTIDDYITFLSQDKDAVEEQFESAEEEKMYFLDLKEKVLCKDEHYLSAQNCKFKNNIKNNISLFKSKIG